MTKLASIILCAVAVCSGCANEDDLCLPKGEVATVLRTGNEEGFRYVVVQRDNGEEVTCTGKTTPIILQKGDKVDGWTMDRVDSTKAP